VDGNKRTGAYGFVWFLRIHGILDTEKLSLPLTKKLFTLSFQKAKLRNKIAAPKVWFGVFLRARVTLFRRIARGEIDVVMQKAQLTIQLPRWVRELFEQSDTTVLAARLRSKDSTACVGLMSIRGKSKKDMPNIFRICCGA
jgi:hypothetical protein